MLWLTSVVMEVFVFNLSVQFRVLAVDQCLRPYKSNGLTVYVTVCITVVVINLTRTYSFVVVKCWWRIRCGLTFLPFIRLYHSCPRINIMCIYMSTVLLMTLFVLVTCTNNHHLIIH